MNEPEEPIEKSESDLEVDQFMEMLTPENIDEYAEPVEETRQVCTIDEDGLVHYSYELEDGRAANAGISLDGMFANNQPGTKAIPGCSENGTGIAGMGIDVFILNEDGTITFVLYEPRKDVTVPGAN